jgi:hypothetical protein
MAHPFPTIIRFAGTSNGSSRPATASFVTSSGVVHDMVADGTYEHGVNDVMQLDFTTPIQVAAAFEAGVLVLRPKGMPGVEVRRWREGGQLLWAYHTAFTARMERID